MSYYIVWHIISCYIISYYIRYYHMMWCDVTCCNVKNKEWVWIGKIILSNVCITSLLYFTLILFSCVSRVFTAYNYDKMISFGQCVRLHLYILFVRVCVYVCVCMCVYVCMCAPTITPTLTLCVCVCVCVWYLNCCWAVGCGGSERRSRGYHRYGRISYG